MRRQCYPGLLAMVVGWITIMISIAINPWFNISVNAFSDLGGLNVKTSNVFNIGLLIAGILCLAYTICINNSIKSRLAAFAAGVYSIAAVNLILIAIYPEGTEPHLFVSVGFFVLIGVSIIFVGLSLIIDGFRKHGLLSVGYAIIGFIGSAVLQWPSIAILELFKLVLITAWVFTMLHYHKVSRF